MLHRHPLLASLSSVEQQDFVQKCRLRSLKRGEVLIADGAVSGDAFFIASGLVRVDMAGIGGRLPVAFLGHQDLVVESFSASAWTAKADYVAVLPSNLWQVALPVCCQLLKTRPAVALAALDLSLSRLHTMRGEMRRLTNDTAETAIGRALYRLAQGPAENRILDRRVTQGTVASYLGMSREQVNKVMRQMEAQGKLSKSESGYEIDPSFSSTGFTDLDSGAGELVPLPPSKKGEPLIRIEFEDTVPGPTSRS